MGEGRKERRPTGGPGQGLEWSVGTMAEGPPTGKSNSEMSGGVQGPEMGPKGHGNRGHSAEGPDGEGQGRKQRKQ